MSSFQSDQNTVSSANTDKDWLIEFDFKLKTELNSLAEKNSQCNAQLIDLLKKRQLSDLAYIKEMQKEIEAIVEILKSMQPFQQFNQESKESVMKHSLNPTTSIDNLIGSLKNEQSTSIKLEIENEDQKKQLILNAKEISMLREACTEKDKQLVENAALIENLQIMCNEKEHAYLNLMKQLQAQSEESSSQLALKDKIIEESHNKERELADQLEAYAYDVRDLKKDREENNERLSANATMLNKFDAIIKIGGSSLVSALEKHASDLFNQKNYEEAIRYYEYAIEIEKLNGNKADKLADLNLWEAQVYVQSNQYTDAVLVLNYALYYRPNCQFSLELRANALFKLNKFLQAKADLERLLSLDPKDNDAKDLLRRVQNQLNQ